MEKTNIKKRGIAAIFALCPVRHILLLAAAVLICAHLITRQNHALCVYLSNSFVRPAHFALTKFYANFHFSVAELMLALAVIAILVWLVLSVVGLIREGERLKRLYKMFITLLMAVSIFYSGFCVLWGEYFYGDDFMTVSGLKNEQISVDELQAVTEYFAEKANEYSVLVARDENGRYCADRKDILARSATVYKNIEHEMPCLVGPEVPAKGIFFSRIMSYLDFTGFFFPYTAEANVNTDFPLPLFPSTVTHELAHLRGVAKEQEANFVAVLSAMASNDPDYCYSAAMLAYTHLGNALYSADYEAWMNVYEGLNDSVKADFNEGNSYWKQFRTPVQKVSNTVYENFMYSYDQKLGLKSYGACVDLLVNYYIDKI